MANLNLNLAVPGVVKEAIDGKDKRSKRRPGWKCITIHHTGTGGRRYTSQPATFWKKFYRNMIHWLTVKDAAYLSAHFVVGREGEMAQLVNPDFYEAFHAGRSTWTDPVTKVRYGDLNGWAVGIELIGDGNIDAYTEAQYVALIKLVVALQKKYSIPKYALTSHSEINPNKVDPGKFFEWKDFRHAIEEAHKPVIS